MTERRTSWALVLPAMAIGAGLAGCSPLALGEATQLGCSGTGQTSFFVLVLTLAFFGIALWRGRDRRG